MSSIYASDVYQNEIVSHGIKKQQDSQIVNSFTTFINIDPGQISQGMYFDNGYTMTQNGYKVIHFNYNALTLTNDFLMSKIVYGQEYKGSDFYNATKIVISIWQNGLKITSLNTSITFYTPLLFTIKILDNNPSNIGYSMFAIKNVPSTTIYSGYKTVTLNYPANQVSNKVYFIDGQLTNIPWTISNGYANFSMSGVGHEVVEYTINNIYYNGMMTTVNVNGVPCLYFPNATNYISPKLILFSDQTQTIKTAYNIATYVTPNYFAVPTAGTYYVVCVHNTTIGLPCDNAITKFTNSIGDIITYSSEINPSWYCLDDGLIEPSQVQSGQLDSYVQKGISYFPNLIKNIIERDYSLQLNDMNSSNYRLCNDNSFLYPTDNTKWVTFSQPCRYVKISKGSQVPVIFVNGLVISPKYSFKDVSVYHLFYADSDLSSGKITVWGTGNSFSESNSYTITVGSDMTATIGPSWKFNTIDTRFNIVSEDWVNHNYTTITDWTQVINDDFVTFTFTSADIGKTYKVYHVNVGYTDYYLKTQTMAFEIPWYLMYSHNLFIFTSGRMTQQYTVIPPVMQTLTQRVTLGLNYMSDVADGEDITILSAPNLELYEERQTLNLTDGVITLNRKDFPFSKKVFMLFINGKFIHPSDIVEISTFTFGIKNVTSINDLRIYINHIDLTDRVQYIQSMLSAVMTSGTSMWDNYINSKTYAQLKTLFNLTDLVNIDTPYDVVTNPLQYLYEILFKFVITDTTDIDDQNTFVASLLADYAPLVQNGRIVLDCNRKGQTARYIWT